MMILQVDGRADRLFVHPVAHATQAEVDAAGRAGWPLSCGLVRVQPIVIHLVGQAPYLDWR